MITGRIEEWWKKTCIKHNCKYYLHEDYPKCSYCTCPDNCIVINEFMAEKENNQKGIEV